MPHGICLAGIYNLVLVGERELRLPTPAAGFAYGFCRLLVMLTQAAIEGFHRPHHRDHVPPSKREDLLWDGWSYTGSDANQM